MCHERYLRRHWREAEESGELWREFERTTPIADPMPQVEPAESEPAEAREEMAPSER